MAGFKFVTLCCAAILVAAVVPAASAVAATVSVSGYVFRDLNNDGVRESGEPGVAGIRVHSSAGNGTPTATTAADGSYALTGLAVQTSGNLTVETGWFRSQCAQLTCAAGPGPDNDFTVANAFIQYPLSKVTANLSNLDVGLLPDWPGSSAAAPAPVAGVVPANSQDVAARLSWVKSTCSDGSYLICSAGDTYTVVSQIMNQGTAPLSGVKAELDLPSGDRLATGDPTRDDTLVTSATSPTVTGLSVSPVDPVSGAITMTLSGSLPPGGLARVTTKALVVGGTGTPGCVPGAVTSLCPKGEPQGAALTLAVTHIDQTGDPDSFGPGCPADGPVSLCPTGIHSKQVEPDEVDPVGHNVNAALNPDPAYNLRGDLQALTPRTPDGAAPGSAVAWRAWAFNDGPSVAQPGWTLTVILPANSSPQVPVANAERTCTAGTTGTGFPFVRCTGKGPISPGVASIAVDVTAQLPAQAVSGTPFAAYAYVQPLATQAAETVPLGVPATSPDADATATATDNDASAAIPTLLVAKLLQLGSRVT